MLLPPPGYCIPNGIEPPRPTRPPNEVAAELCIPSGAKVVGQIARIQPYKGQDLLFEAAALVLAQEPDAFFLVIGYPAYNQVGIDYHESLKQMVARLGISDRVRMISYPGNIGDIWPFVDIHVHPTLLDSSPTGAARGDVGGEASHHDAGRGIHELVIDGETGMYFRREIRRRWPTLFCGFCRIQLRLPVLGGMPDYGTRPATLLTLWRDGWSSYLRRSMPIHASGAKLNGSECAAWW